MLHSRKISTMWFDGALHDVARVCLSSMVAHGMDVTLHTYGEIPNVPDGVALADGNEILDRALLERLQPIKRKSHASWQPMMNFSDFFRIAQLRDDKGLWLDTDVFIFRPFEYDPQKVYFANEGNGRVGSPVFYLPPEHPIIQEYEDLIAQPELMPNWLGFVRGRLRPAIWKMAGIKFSPADLGITIYGNDAFSRLTRRYGCYDDALAKSSFYKWTGNKAEDLFRDVPFQQLRDNPAHIGIHIHRKALQNQPVQKGSFWEWALETYG